jgi:hypothetical protein
MTKFGWLITIRTANKNSQVFVSDYNLTGKGIMLGRDNSCDIIIDNAYVSRQHCLVRLNNDVLQINDLSSTNKIFIDENIIPVNRRTVWTENSTLRLGAKKVGTELIARRIELKDLPLGTVLIDKHNITSSNLEESSKLEESTKLIKDHQHKLPFYAVIFNKKIFDSLLLVLLLLFITYNITKNYYDQRVIKVTNDEIISVDIDQPTITNNITKRNLDKKYQHINFGNFFALVIGNNDYQYIDSLENAIMDAEAVADILIKDYKYKVTKIINGTRNDILSMLDYMRNHLTHEDNLLIFFAGHGLYDQDSDRGYWLPIDAKLNTRTNWISNADVTDAIKAIKAKHVMIVADSCYAGSLTRSVEIIQPIFNIDVVERINSLRSRTVLASGGVEPVVDYGGKLTKIGNFETKHSIFTAVFIGILSKNQNIIDGAGLFSQLRDPVRLNAEQMPIYDNIRNANHEIGGDFLFIRH